MAGPSWTPVPWLDHVVQYVLDPNCHRNYPPVASNMPSWEITEKKNRSFEWENTRTQWGIFQQTMINIDKLCLITRRLLGIHPLARLISIHFAIFPPWDPLGMAGTSTFRCWSASTVIRLSSSSTNLQVPNSQQRRAICQSISDLRKFYMGYQVMSMDINGYQWISGDIEKLKNWTTYVFFDPTHLNQRGISLKIGMLWSG